MTIPRNYAAFKLLAMQCVTLDESLSNTARCPNAVWEGTLHTDKRLIESFRIRVNPDMPQWVFPIALEGVIRRAWYANKSGFTLKGAALETMGTLAEYRRAQALEEANRYFDYCSDRFPYQYRDWTVAYHKVTWVGKFLIRQINRAIQRPLDRSNLPFIYYSHAPWVKLNTSTQVVDFDDKLLCDKVAKALGNAVTGKGGWYIKYHAHQND